MRPLSKQLGFRSVEERLRELSARDDPLEKLLKIIDFERVRPLLSGAFDLADSSKGADRCSRRF